MPTFSYTTYKEHVREANPKYNKTFSSLRRSGLRKLLLAHDNEDLATLPRQEQEKIKRALKKIKAKYTGVRDYVNRCLGAQISLTQLQSAKGGLRDIGDKNATRKQLSSTPQVHQQLVPLDLKRITGPVNVIYSKCPFWERSGDYGTVWTQVGRCPTTTSPTSLASCRTAICESGRNPTVNLKGFLMECQSILRMIEGARKKLQAGVQLLRRNPNLNTTTNATLVSCKRFWGKLGTLDATRKHWNLVDKNFGAMRAALVPGRMGKQELLRVVESSGAPCGAGNYAFTYPSVHKPPFIWLGEAVFEDVTGNLPPHPGISKPYIRYDNTAMTLLHELSHAVIGTNDVVPYRKHNTARVSNGGPMLSAAAANAAYPGSIDNTQTISLEQRLVGGNPRMVFRTTDIEQLAQHRPLWTADNAHSYACFGAHCDQLAPGAFWR